ncbi:MAG: hypothetical protein ABSF63_05375 [Candidatus Bathyarchaeia archaeon]
MTSARNILSAEVIFVIIISIGAAQTVQSQNLTTLTEYGVSSSTQVVTGWGGLVVRGSLVVPGAGETLPSGFTGGSAACGGYTNVQFLASAAEVLRGPVTTTAAILQIPEGVYSTITFGPVDLYLMTEPEFQALQQQILSGGSCTPLAVVASQKDAASYFVTWAVPAAGTYEFVIVNVSATTVDAIVNLGIGPPAFTPTTYTAGVWPVTQQVVETISQVTEMTQVSPTAPQPTFPEDYFWRVLFHIIGIIAAASLLICAALALWKVSNTRRKESYRGEEKTHLKPDTQPATHRYSDPAKTVGVTVKPIHSASVRKCKNCGADVPNERIICGKCQMPA